MFYCVLVYYLDLVFFALFCVAIGLYADFRVLRSHAAGRPRYQIWLCSLILMAIGLHGALWVGNMQRDRLRVGIQGVAPSYAVALELMGHDKIKLDTPPDDPLYLTLLERQKEWLRIYPAISDIYTMREVAPGELALIVDSETDYDGDGKYLDDREQRTPIGEIYSPADQFMLRAMRGESVFNDVPITDRWGTWVSAYTPMHTAGGKIEAIVGIDFAAADWIRTLLLGRGCVLGASATVLLGLTILICAFHLQRAEIEAERRFSQQLHAQKRVIEDSLRKLRSYEFVLDSHALVCVTDPEGAILHANQKYSDLCGHPREQLIGQPHHAIDSPHHAASIWQDIWRTVREGQVWHGEVCSRDRQGEVYWVDTTVVPYADASQQVTQHIAMGTDITAKKRYEVELVQAARIDKLTGLPNRALFHERMKSAIQQSRLDANFRFALMFLDFDRFKLINDSLGHNVGDLLLQQIAERLRAEIKTEESVHLQVTGNTVARLGGDEFVVLMTQFESPSDVFEIANRLLEAFEVPYKLYDYNVRSTASIGIVFSDPRYATAEEVVRDADTAMYAAKSRGRACFAIFDESMQLAVLNRLQLESDMRDGLENEEFHVGYQPIVSLHDGSVTAVEAFLTWDHPTRGTLGPDDFLAIAEETRLIVPLGEQLLEKACRQFVRWQRDLKEAAPQYLSMHLTQNQWNDPTLVSQVLQALYVSGMNPSHLQLEIGEPEFMHHQFAALPTLQTLQSTGVRIALDNFGSGNSSIACLQKFAFHVLKIDVSLVSCVGGSNPETVLVETICNMVEQLKMTSIAEGISTPEQAELLKKLNCHCGEGLCFQLPSCLAPEPTDSERSLAPVC